MSFHIPLLRHHLSTCVAGKLSVCFWYHTLQDCTHVWEWQINNISFTYFNALTAITFDGFVIDFIMHSQGIASFTPLATNFTLVFDVKMTFHMSFHVPLLRHHLTTRVARKLSVGFCYHTLQDCTHVWERQINKNASCKSEIKFINSHHLCKSEIVT